MSVRLNTAPDVPTALREQARLAIQGLAQAVLDEPGNRPLFERFPDRQELARRLFQDALVVVYRHLVTLKLTASGRPGAAVLGPGSVFFGEGSAPLLDDARLAWGEHAEARLLDHLRFLPGGKKGERRRVDHGALCVEDLGSVYEGLVELSPGIATEPMCRLRRRRLEVVVPLAQAGGARAEGGSGPRGAERREILPEGAFYLHVGLGRKTRGSYYTPRAFVRFLIQETLGPSVEARSPPRSPDANAILGIKVLDPAMGSGHFLVEACRFLAGAVADAWARTGEIEAVRRAHGDPLSHARRLVVERCLYGVDRDPMAVSLAKLSLWLESGAEGAPPASLDLRLLCGDSLTGPFADRLGAPPSGGDGPRVDFPPCTSIAALKTLAAAWSGAVMLGEDLDGDHHALARAVAGGDDIEALVGARPALSAAIEAGREGVCHDLVFPEVFWPEGLFSGAGRAGFDAVVGNPPWGAVRRNDDEIFAGFDLDLLDLPTRAEKRPTIEALSKDAAIAGAFDAYVRGLERKDRIASALYEVHKARVRGALAGRGTYDDYMLFAERSASLVAPGGGRVGMVFPAAFHANEGAVGVRRLYFESLRLERCFSFENRRRLFEIDGRCKFALVVARSGGPRAAARCAFYLQDPEWLSEAEGALLYEQDFIEKTGGEHLSLLELRSPLDLGIAQVCFDRGETFGAARARLGVTLGQEVNMTYASDRFTPTGRVAPEGTDPRDPGAARRLLAEGYVPLHEGKTFHQYTDRWEDRPRYLVALDAIADRPSWRRAARHYRLAFRDIASSTNERTGIFCLLPPGVLCGNKAPCEREPSARPDAASLCLLAIAGAFSFDHVLRFKVQSTVNLFILDACPVPPSAFTLPRSRFLAHAALRLSCNHEGYLPLWQGQLGPGTWRETTPVYTWPVLADEGARWAVRAAVDAVVAEAYGLSRDQYAHVLAAFKHTMYPAAPALCLAAFDELAEAGVSVFTEVHDPYRDIPLCESLPWPIVDL